MNPFNAFYKKTSAERKEILVQKGRYDLQLDTPLPEETYSHMIENSITTYEIPMGIATGYLINDKEYLVPMATEEPSVIAAASNAAKIIAQNKGFKAKVISRIMSGEIAFDNPVDPIAMNTYIETHQEELFEIANKAHPSIIKRGGGIKKIHSSILQSENLTPFFIVRIDVDTQEAMGANIINTILEALAIHLELTFNQSPLMAILTNLSDNCIVEAEVLIDPKSLKEPDTIANRIVAASHLSIVDPYRTATHNKGVMNGITALVLASGNDTRAIEASMYSYAKGKPFTLWTMENDLIKGTITIPMPIGFVGGSIGLNPKAQLAHKIMDISSAEELMIIIASVGLAQNFAALYALTTDGIQKGHMRLHAKSIAINAGATKDNVDEVTTLLLKEQHINLETAKKIMKEKKQ